MSSEEHGIEPIRRLAGQANGRIRLARAVRAGPIVLSAALIVAVVVLASRKLGFVGEGAARSLLFAAVASAMAAVVVVWRWPVLERDGALALDRFHGLHDRLSSALAFAALPERTPFMRAAVADALRVAPTVLPRAAVPIRVPSGLGMAAGLAGLLVAVTLFEVRTHRPVVHALTIDPVEMAPDDLDDVRDFLNRIKQQDVTDETKSAIEEFNKLVDDIANHRLDRTEAFRRMAALEEKLLTGSEADKKALESELANIGEELKKSDLLKPAGAALERGNLDQARDALHDLAKKARDHAGAIDKAKLEQMREALKSAAGDAQRRKEEIDRRRQELADEILKRKEKAGAKPSDEERSLLEKKQRELERLDRDLGEKQSSERRLDRLDRDLQQAAEDLMKDLGVSADDLEQSAEDLNSMDRGETSEKEKEELKQKLEELRQLVRQQGSQGQVQRLKRFGRMARGQGGQGKNDPNGAGGNGPNGQGQNGQGGDEGQGGPQGQGQGQDGQGGQNGGGKGGGQGGETWILGPSGEKMLLLTKGQGGGQGGKESGGSGSGSQRGRWGDGHDPNVAGKETDPKMGTQDSQVQGADSAQGGSRSQVILGAAERGFASRPYQRVYTEYHQVAEESLAKDEVPGGYRFYVKRYFQLIRPREDR
jgi:hypothetical protein